MDKLIHTLLQPMGDDDIENYLSNPTIIKYSELKNYTNIEDLLPNRKSYFILLYETDLNEGHWCCCMRDKHNNLIYFDSYGHEISEPLKWNSKEKNIELGQDRPYLNYLFDMTPLEVYYNAYKFQNDNSDISTCGRYCVAVIKAMKEGVSLHEFINIFKNLQKKFNIKPDLIISKVISR